MTAGASRTAPVAVSQLALPRHASHVEELLIALAGSGGLVSRTPAAPSTTRARKVNVPSSRSAAVDLAGTAVDDLLLDAAAYLPLESWVALGCRTSACTTGVEVSSM